MHYAGDQDILESLSTRSKEGALKRELKDREEEAENDPLRKSF